MSNNHNSSQQLMLGIVWSALHPLTHLILPTRQDYHFVYFTDEETEAQRRWLAWVCSHWGGRAGIQTIPQPCAPQGGSVCILLLATSVMTSRLSHVKAWMTETSCLMVAKYAESMDYSLLRHAPYSGYLVPECSIFYNYPQHSAERTFAEESHCLPPSPFQRISLHPPTLAPHQRFTRTWKRQLL